MLRHLLSTIVGKLVRLVARFRGGGSALPGLIVEKIDPLYLSRTLRDLPEGVVVISGTNGKTTTTKVVVELLEASGLRVFTNRTGSNFSRGVIAALLGEVSLGGKLDADIAVLELDEAWAVKFVEKIKPRYSLLLNVMRDQLDRFGEIDIAAKMLTKIASATTDTVILNRDDRRIFDAAKKTNAKTAYFGTTTELLTMMPSDDMLKSGGAAENREVAADVLLEAISGQQASYLIDGNRHTVSLQLTGVYNFLNAGAALALVRVIVGQSVPTIKMLSSLSTIRPAFGRGETILLDDTPIELILVKNPSGFRLALMSFAKKNARTMIAVNDSYADGRDMSWLWDVDFSRVGTVDMISGSRAYDMALRLRYDDINFDKVEPELEKALHGFLEDSPSAPKNIFCTYTAMIRLRKLLAEKTNVETIS